MTNGKLCDIICELPQKATVINRIEQETDGFEKTKSNHIRAADEPRETSKKSQKTFEKPLDKRKGL